MRTVYFFVMGLIRPFIEMTTTVTGRACRTIQSNPFVVSGLAGIVLFCMGSLLFSTPNPLLRTAVNGLTAFSFVLSGIAYLRNPSWDEMHDLIIIGDPRSEPAGLHMFSGLLAAGATVQVVPLFAQDLSSTKQIMLSLFVGLMYILSVTLITFTGKILTTFIQGPITNWARRTYERGRDWHHS